MTDEYNLHTHEEYMQEFSKLRVQKLFDINDPDYTWYDPVIDPTADAYVILVPYTNNWRIDRNIIAVHIPMYIDTITISNCYFNGVDINLLDTLDTPIEVILSQTRALPDPEEPQLENYRRIVVGTPYIRDEFVIRTKEACIFYLEVLYFNPRTRDTFSFPVVKVHANNDFVFTYPGHIMWHNFKNIKRIKREEYSESDDELYMSCYRKLYTRNDSVLSKLLRMLE